ncbi:serine hydrolase domain-containing protein [Luethyella okanaganae]|uniref:Serine hydrolase domain-containing protein n=2 Tax=Luethyella okanaganae TaxID=69372 RepID=A0ABW1VG46_9MICO
MRARRTIVVAIVAAIATFTVGAVAIPRPPALSTVTSGDSELVAEVRQLLEESPSVRDRVSVAVIDGGTVREAHFGATGGTEYEIGSVTKTMTGSLLAEAIDRGEVAADTTLGELLDLGTTPAASITLTELATHHSGLPRLAASPGQILSAIISKLRASDPYGASVAELLASARDAQLNEKEFLYSNFGFALLGQALASAADADYPSLLSERVFEPLGMTGSFAPTSPDDLAPDAPTGYTASGRTSDPWTLGADAPAGSVRSTLTDMVRYATAQLHQTAPGVKATFPHSQAGKGRTIGYAWITTDNVTWHNGATGGFTSWIGFDRESERAVVILNNTAAPVDDLGFMLLGTS